MPSSTPDTAVALAIEIADDLPYEDLRHIAAALAGGRDKAFALRRQASNPRLRHAIGRLLALPDDPAFLSSALLAGGAAGRREHQRG